MSYEQSGYPGIILNNPTRFAYSLNGE
jgi:hypothetical protein